MSQIKKNVTNKTKPLPIKKILKSRLGNKTNLNNTNINNIKLKHSYSDLIKLLEIVLQLQKKKKLIKPSNRKNNSRTNHSNTNRNIIDGVSSSNEIELSQPNLITVLPSSHNVNQYRLLEHEISNMRNQYNNSNRNNALPQIENKHEVPINWTHKNTDALELVRKVAKHRDVNAANELVKVVPEFKHMLEDIAEIGASGAKEHIKTLHKDITILENNKNQLEENNNKMNYEINNLQQSLSEIEYNKQEVEQKYSDIEQEFLSKSKEYDDLTDLTSSITNQNYELMKLNESKTDEINGLEMLYNTTKKGLDKLINQEQDRLNKIDELNKIIDDKNKKLNY